MTPTTQPKIGRPLTDDRPRVSHSVSISAKTNDNLGIWLAQLIETDPKANNGKVIDRMAVFCARRGFDPLRPVRPRKKPAQASTPEPAKPATSGKA